MKRAPLITSLGLLWLSQLSSAAHGAPRDLEQGSVLVEDLVAMLRPFVASCAEQRGAREQLRCEALNERLRAQHLGRLYRSIHRPSVLGPLVVHVVARPQPHAELEVRGCLTCEEPLLERAGGDVNKGRFFLFKVPREIRIRSGPHPYDLGEISVARYRLALPARMTEQAFRAELLPHLRLELFFRPLAGVTRVGEPHPYNVVNFELVAHRVYQACTGEVYGASARLAQVPLRPDAREESCPSLSLPRAAAASPRALHAPRPPRSDDELRALVSSELRTCYEQFGVAGALALDLVVSPSGQLRQVQLTGKLAGPPTGPCVERLLKNFAFPSFAGEELRLHWSLTLGD